MQRPPKRTPIARYGVVTPTAQKERVPVTYGTTGAKPHPTAPYTFVNHNTTGRAGPTAAPVPGGPGGPSDVALPAVESRASVITFGAAEVPTTTAAASPKGSQMPAFGHQPRLVRAVGNAPVQLGVEGVRTGEEVVVEAPAARKRSSVEDGSVSSSTAELEALRRKLATSREECKGLQEKLQRRKQEVNKSQRIAALVSEEAEKRLGVATRAWEARASCCFDLAGEALKEAGEAHTKQRSAHDAQVRALQDRLDRDTASFDSRLSALTKELDDTKQAARQSEVSEMDSLREQVVQLRGELSSVRQQHAIETQTLEAKVMGVQQDLHTTQKTLQEKLVLLAANELLVAQCRQFVLSICQPGFSVVKDQTLEPVDKNRGEPSGFVLVPLLVLLHGYALLPESERRDVIDTYEKKAAVT